MSNVLVAWRVGMAAFLAWSATLTAAGSIVLFLSGADLHTTVGAPRPALVLDIPVSSTVPMPVAPIAVEEALWSVPLTGQPGWVATGTLVAWEGRHYLMTASHAVQYAPFLAWLGIAPEAQPLVQRSRDGRAWPLGWGHVNYTWDLAFYSAPGDGTLALTISRQAPALGDMVRFVGYPFQEARPWTATGPVIAVSAHPWQPGAAAVLAAIAPQHGQSGGALVDSQGHLVGIGVALTPWGVLAVGNGAIGAVLGGSERLYTPEPPPPGWRWALGGVLVVVAVGLTLAIDLGFKQAAARLRRHQGRPAGE